MFESIISGLGYPFKDKNWVTKWLFSLVWFIPVVGFFLLVGYQVKALRENIAEAKQELPEWNDWMGLFLDGIRGTAVTLFYLAIPLGLFFLSFLPYILGVIGISVTNDETIQMLSFFGGSAMTVLLMIFSSVILFIACAFTPMALALFVARGSILSGLNVFGVIGKILSNFVYYSLIIIVSVVINSLYVVIINIPIIGTLIGGIMMPLYVFYASMFYAKTIGDMFRIKRIA